MHLITIGKRNSVAYGINGYFKTIPAGVGGGYRVIPIHMGSVKFLLSSIEATFTATHEGVVLQEGEFSYESRDGLLRITNVAGVTGMAIDNFSPFAIPIGYEERPPIILTNIYPISLNITG